LECSFFFPDISICAFFDFLGGLNQASHYYFIFVFQLEKEQKRLLQRVKDTSNELRAISRDRDQKEGALNELKMEHELMQNAVSVKLLIAFNPLLIPELFANNASFLDILEIFSLKMSQISSNVPKKAFAT